MLGLPGSTEVRRPLPKAQLYRSLEWTPSQRERFDGEVSRLDFVNWISPRTIPSIAGGTEVKEIFVVEVALKKRDFDPKSIEMLAKSIPQRIVYALRFDEEVRLAVFHTRLFLTEWQSLTPNSSLLILKGLTLDAVWTHIVRTIANLPMTPPKVPQTHVGTSLRDVDPPMDSPKTTVTHVGTSLCDVDHMRSVDSTPIPHAKGMSLQGLRPDSVSSFQALNDHIKAQEERTKLERQIATLERQMNATKQPRRKRELFVELQKLKSIL